MRKLAPIFLTLIMLINSANLVYAAPTTTDQLQEELRLRKAEIDSIGSRITDYQKRLEELSKKQAGLKNDLAIIGNETEIAQLDVESLRLSIEAQRLQIDIIEKQVQDSVVDLKRQKTYLRNVLVEMQRTQDTTPLEVIFSSAGMHEALSGIEHMTTVSGQLEKELGQTRALRDELQAKQSTQQEKVDELTDLQSELEARIAILEQRKAAADLLVAETNNSESQYRVLMSELRQEQAGITSRILELQDAIKQRIRDEEGDAAVDDGQTTITSPLKSYVITATFKDPTYPFRNVSPHTGIDLAAPMGTPIYAAAPGVVSWVRAGSTGYGNYVMVIHDDGLATLYAHMSRFGVTQDQYVKRGDIIGYVGSTGFSTGPHLHFEVRLNGIPVDPKAYVSL